MDASQSREIKYFFGTIGFVFGALAVAMIAAVGFNMMFESF
jgi:hypothetical protein